MFHYIFSLFDQLRDILFKYASPYNHCGSSVISFKAPTVESESVLLLDSLIVCDSYAILIQQKKIWVGADWTELLYLIFQFRTYSC